MRTMLLVLLLALQGLTGSAPAADAYPTRSIRWVVSYPPGGTTDLLARIMGQWLSQRLGHQAIVDNRPGAGNNIGTESAVRAAPDGHTIFLVNPANAVNATLSDAGIRAKLADLGGVPIPGTPQEFWALHRMETEKWAKVVRLSGAKVEQRARPSKRFDPCQSRAASGALSCDRASGAPVSPGVEARWRVSSRGAR